WNLGQGQKPRQRDDEGNDNGKTGTIDENSRNHLAAPAAGLTGGFALSPPISARAAAAAGSPARPRAPATPGPPPRRPPRAAPSPTPLSPCWGPLSTAATVVVDCPRWMRCCSTLLPAPTT